MTLAWGVLAMVAWFLTCLAAISTRVFMEFSMSELERYCQQRKQRDFFAHVLEHHERLVAAPQLLMVLALSAFLAAYVAWLDGVDFRTGAGMAWLALGLVAMVTAVVWMPQAVVRFWSAPLLFHSWRFWVATHYVLTPLIACGWIWEGVAKRLSGHVQSPDEEEEAFEDEIRTMVTAGLHDGHLEADAREMIEGVIELSDVDVGDIMTPRSQIDAISVDASWEEIVRHMNSGGHTRVPVFRDKLDQIVGVLYAKDLISELARPQLERNSLEQIARPAWFVPATKAVDELLREFKRTRKHMAIVWDEYRSIAGVVTIEDALEEIVGEIVDEYDHDEESEIISIDGDTIEVLGRTHLDDVNDALGLLLASPDETDTIAGLVIAGLGRIPQSGEVFKPEGAKITVLEANRRQITKLRVERLIQPVAESQRGA